MKFIAEIDVMPLEALLDPQGKAVQQGLKNLDLKDVNNVRIGKHIRMEIDADNEDTAKKATEKACKELLCNHIMESYSYEIKKA